MLAFCISLQQQQNVRFDLKQFNRYGLGATEADQMRSEQHVKRNRRSRRLQKKNSLDVQFRRRFSMLKEVNNNSPSGVMLDGADAGGGMCLTEMNGSGRGGGGGVSKTNSMLASNVGRRASIGNLSTTKMFQDRRFNKMLISMHDKHDNTAAASPHTRKQYHVDRQASDSHRPYEHSQIANELDVKQRSKHNRTKRTAPTQDD